MLLAESATKQVLIVEDEGLIAMDIQTRLQSFGCSAPIIARSFQEALDAVRGSTFDLVLMDIRIQGERDGITTAQAIKAESDIPLIYLTAHADREMIRRAKLTEPHGYLLKPVRTVDLQNVIEIAMYKHR